MDDQIAWPAVISYAGDGELGYVTDRAEWLADADLSAFDYDPADRLVDSHGQVFALSLRGNGHVVPRAPGARLTCEQFADLLRDHFSAVGECCVSKLSLDNIAEGMELLRQQVES